MPTKKRSPANHRTRYLVYGSVGIGVAICLGLFVMFFGRISGSEFSPDRFETRFFTVHEIPWLQIQISPIRRTTQSSMTSRYLAAQALVSTTSQNSNSSATWHIVSLSRAGVTASNGDARLLTEQLDAAVYQNGQSVPVWRDWSQKNPALAKVLWPEIQKLAKRELYILMPRLFSFANQAKDVGDLKRQIDDYLRLSYAELVSEMRDAGRPELAAELLAEALSDYPSDPGLQKLR